MKKLITLWITLIVCVSCAATRTPKYTMPELSGTFTYCSNKPHFNYCYKLELSSDSSFVFEQQFQESRPKCRGVWKLEKNIISLLCNNREPIETFLSRGYMKTKEYSITIINNNELKEHFKDRN